METEDLPPVEPPPHGACDCHAHVYGPPERYPFQASPRYAPPALYYADYQKMLDRLGVERAVVVQPTVYQTNAVSEDALAASAGAWRGVAKFTDARMVDDIERLNGAGFRGVRLHAVGGAGDLAHLEEVARRIAPFGWHIQLHIDSHFLAETEARIAALPVPVVHDHFAKLDPAEGVAGAPMQVLLRLLARGRSWVKLSGSYLVSRQPLPHPDLVPIARALVAARPDRMLWGTDWPHPSHTGPRLDDADFLRLLALWVPERATRNAILVANPEALYGFEPQAG